MDANRYFSIKKLNVFNIIINICYPCGVVTLSACLVPLQLVIYTNVEEICTFTGWYFSSL